jgi:hypothetical protein
MSSLSLCIYSYIFLLYEYSVCILLYSDRCPLCYCRYINRREGRFIAYDYAFWCIFLSVYGRLIAENYTGLLLHVILICFCLLCWGLCLGVLLASWVRLPDYGRSLEGVVCFVLCTSDSMWLILSPLHSLYGIVLWAFVYYFTWYFLLFRLWFLQSVYSVHFVCMLSINWKCPLCLWPSFRYEGKFCYVFVHVTL